ncbi:hypothetical protein [Methylibium sp. T29]|uniref:hypothetical protein n=2 Tax=unclassified Methylibium TaxID=2633235 RepID=UPI0003F41D35|nr:hypothetical protein [Methylibium sp. T29]EWS53024.1 hypothetical protein X551_04190 [Methylibium sp. T29]EWS58507.1 hypothetical protein Y694_03603 [Methylibium sp. T29-B]
MLHGVGGRTVEEAKDRMSYQEAMAWAEYIRRRGSLNWGMRLESGFALLATQINRALGGKAEFEDFMMHKDVVEADISDVAKLLGVRGVK